MNDWTNLYSEIVDVLGRNGKTLNDIRYVYLANTSVGFEVSEFLEMAKWIDYDSGYGSAKINSRLVIEGDDFRLVREEYDGSEWFKYICLKPRIPQDIHQITRAIILPEYAYCPWEGYDE